MRCRDSSGPCVPPLGAAGNAPQASGWQRDILPLLEDRLKDAQTAMAHHAIGDQEPLVSLALKSRYLARETDGYSLVFAGEELATQYEDRRRLVVFAAWQGLRIRRRRLKDG